MKQLYVCEDCEGEFERPSAVRLYRCTLHGLFNASEGKGNTGRLCPVCGRMSRLAGVESCPLYGKGEMMDIVS